MSSFLVALPILISASASLTIFITLLLRIIINFKRNIVTFTINLSLRSARFHLSYVRIIQQPGILYAGSVANGNKDALNGKTAMNLFSWRLKSTFVDKITSGIMYDNHPFHSFIHISFVCFSFLHPIISTQIIPQLLLSSLLRKGLSTHCYQKDL